MSTSSPARTVSYGASDFEDAVERIDEALRSGGGMTFLLVGASEEQKQDALTKLSAPGQLSLHRFSVTNLVGERLVETQGNLRKAFDNADEKAAVLFFDEADVLLDRSQDRPDAAASKTKEEQKADQREDQESEALSDYFFGRVENYPGITVVCFSSSEYANRLEDHHADVVVEF